MRAAATFSSQNYRYQPRDPVAQQYFQRQTTQVQSAPAQPVATQQQAAPQRKPVAASQVQQPTYMTPPGSETGLHGTSGPSEAG